MPTSVRALKGGAIDRKPVPPKTLIERIPEAIEVDRCTREAAAPRAAVADRIAQLTPRERQVMELLAVGKSSKQIATALNISVRTVESHRRTVLRKMEVRRCSWLVPSPVSGCRRPALHSKTFGEAVSMGGTAHAASRA